MTEQTPSQQELDAAAPQTTTDHRESDSTDRQAALRLDYEQTINLWAHLVDVRFRLLALVPVLSAAGIGLLGQVNDLASFRIALVALLAVASVIALCIYDLRNSLFHDFTLHRAKALERELKFKRTTRTLDGNDKPTILGPAAGANLGGVFSERPRARVRLLGVQVWHDRALTIAYCVSAGAWAALAGYSLSARLDPTLSPGVHQCIAAIVGAALTATLWFGIWRHDSRVAYYLHTLTGGHSPQQPWKPWTKSTEWSRKPWTWSTTWRNRLVKKWVEAANPSVLFLCRDKAGRSQMAAGWLQHLAGDRLYVCSGVSEPTSEINPAVIIAMAELGIDITTRDPKPWTHEIVRGADVLVTIGCSGACLPIFPGNRYEDWDVADPAGLDVDAVRPIRDDIRRRVETLVASLQLQDA